ncbi:MAG TPA: ABC transporter permease [Thermoanaerobaculia bacterium]|nr:ABC transporter permease [Thermoanaerobaculia bacterium]
MTGYLLRRLAVSLLLFALVLSFTFVLVHAAPGSAADALAGEGPGRALRVERLERTLGLDRPLPQQYAAWLGRAARGDLGTSFVQNRPVASILADALPATLLLGLAATFVEWLVALPLGIWAARRHGGTADHLLRGASLLLVSVPSFWLAIMAVLAFAYLWPVLPAGHMLSAGAEHLGTVERWADLGRHLLLPAVVLGLASAGSTLRLVRNSVLDVLGEDYVRTARAKGLSERRVLWRHGLPNAMAPLAQVLGLGLPVVLNGVLVVEVVFAWPGLGRVAWNAILTRDLPLVLGTTALSAVLVIAGNLLADLLHAAADPRVRRA